MRPMPMTRNKFTIGYELKSCAIETSFAPIRREKSFDNFFKISEPQKLNESVNN